MDCGGFMVEMINENLKISGYSVGDTVTRDFLLHLKRWDIFSIIGVI